MNTLESEVIEALAAANFQRAIQLAESQLRNLDPHEEVVDRYREIYAVCRFFLHRSERIQHQPQGAERARMFVHYLKELNSFLLDSNIQKKSEQIQDLAYQYLHKQISAGFAHDFAGQRAYNLDRKEIFQLVFSLLFIRNHKSAREVLLFLHSMKRDTALVSLLTAICDYEMGRMAAFQENFLVAMLEQPEAASGYLQFLNIPELQPYIEEAAQVEPADSPGFWIRLAMLLEVNNQPLGRPMPSEAMLSKAEDRVKSLAVMKSQSSRNMNRIVQLSAFLLRFNPKGLSSIMHSELVDFIQSYRPELIEQFNSSF